MFSVGTGILKGNLAFVPIVVLLNILGFHLEDAKQYKVFRYLHSLSLLIVLFLVSSFVQYKVEASVVVATITYINARCIHLTLIIIHIRSIIASKSVRGVFERLDNIDLRLRTSFDVRIKDDESKWFMRTTLVLVFISALCSFAFDCFNDETFNVGQLVHAMLVFILSVKILFYCMLCTSIKVRFETLIKYLNDSKSSRAKLAAKATKFVATKSIVNVSQVKDISLIYDEVLEAILLLNESFSALLSATFGKMALKMSLNACWDKLLLIERIAFKTLFIWIPYSLSEKIKTFLSMEPHPRYVSVTDSVCKRQQGEAFHYIHVMKSFSTRALFQ